jgi:hypothetical protein
MDDCRERRRSVQTAQILNPRGSVAAAPSVNEIYLLDVLPIGNTAKMKIRLLIDFTVVAKAYYGGGVFSFLLSEIIYGHYNH